MGSKRVNVKAILADADLRRKLMVSTIQATQAREGIDTTAEQAGRAYYVASEGERIAFFGLKEFRAAGGRPERRERKFVEAIRNRNDPVRTDVRRADFAAMEGSSLAYRWVQILAPYFRENPPLDPAVADAKQGLISTESDRFVRYRWECGIGCKHNWVPYAKGGEFCRFYSDLRLVFDWTDNGAAIKAISAERYGSASRTIKCEEYYFRSGITWVEKTVKGMNARILPPGAIFNVAGPSAFPHRTTDTDYLLAILNATLSQAFLQCFSTRSWGAEYVGRIPVAAGTAAAKEHVAILARSIHDAKAAWDAGNETSGGFRSPWLVRVDGQDLVERLAAVSAEEEACEADIREAYAELNNGVYQIYGVPDVTRRVIEDILGERPAEFIWPEMEGTAAEQKRMEHVWRLLSYAVKRVLEADDDGIVSFNAVNGELRLVDRVRHQLATLFPGRDANQLEVEIANELRRTVKGYRKCASLEEWLDNVFFEYHCALYRSRPIFWHIASAQGTTPFAFGALVHYQRFDKNRMAKLRASYLRDAIEEFRREAGLADKAGRTDDRIDWQAKVEEAQALDRKLQLIQEGYHEGAEGGERDYRILTPWKKPDERPKGWAPDLDDGVKVNIGPFEKAGALRLGKVT